ncbi:cerebellin-3-like [Dreissena polymorpha]|uniref:C1q domain-containing protein n=1 Tax=Dreissena polymorpha TaxID=45954 RepID=A0A9D4C0X8_DREPO|nr:cerebellin-3-like [Dreissena polymorpha]KAH3715283.1 hypothetical protein DPMN_057989 [Dreissena polymorpha]
MVHDVIIETLEKDNNLPVNKSIQDESNHSLFEKEIRSTAVQPVKNRFVPGEVVAFSAMKVANQQHIGLNQNIIFEQVLTNEGDGYHPLHGVFIAPQSGLYVLSSAVLTFWGQEIHTAIIHNGNIIARIYGHGDNGRHDQGSQTVVLKLNVGDEVAVQNIDYADTNIFGEVYSSFSGYLLSPQ